MNCTQTAVQPVIKAKRARPPKTPKFDEIPDKERDARIQEEVRMANAMLRDHPGLTRTEALRAARETLAPLNVLNWVR